MYVVKFIWVEKLLNFSLILNLVSLKIAQMTSLPLGCHVIFHVAATSSAMWLQHRLPRGCHVAATSSSMSAATSSAMSLPHHHPCQRLHHHPAEKAQVASSDEVAGRPHRGCHLITTPPKLYKKENT
jgi:hypothetical protein